MYLFIIFIIFIAWFIGMIFLENNSNTDWTPGIIISGVLSIVMLCIIIITNICGYINQLYDIESYSATQKKITLYEEKTKLLTIKFSQILEKEYPEHEKNLFESMTPDNIDVLLVSYPEIKSSKTSIELVNQLLNLNNEIYQQKESLIELNKDIDFRSRNKLFIQWVIPKMK